jgi:RNA polymerase sigma-70 factor (ECF subfamily)
VAGVRVERVVIGGLDLEGVFRDHGGTLWRTVYAYSGGRRDVADDAVSEAFARAIEHQGTIRSPVPWLYRTALRLAAADLKRERRQADVEAVREGEARKNDGLVEVIQALRQLSPTQRVVVVLRYEADLSIRAIAERLGISPVAVRVHLFRARERLRRILGEEDEG